MRKFPYLAYQVLRKKYGGIRNLNIKENRIHPVDLSFHILPLSNLHYFKKLLGFYQIRLQREQLPQLGVKIHPYGQIDYEEEHCLEEEKDTLPAQYDPNY